MRSVLLLLLLSMQSLEGFPQLFTFTFSGAGTCPTQGSNLSVQPTGLTVSSLTRMGSLTCSPVADCFTTASFTNAASIDSAQYIEFTIAVTPGVSLTAKSLSFATSRTTKGPVNGLVMHDGGIGTFSASNSFAINTTSSVVTWDFADVTSAAGTTLRFRIYGWSANALNGTMRLDDVSFQGTISSSSPLYIDHVNQRVGIGITTPTAQLHTSGTVRIAGLGRSDSLERIVVADSNGNLHYKTMPQIKSGWNLQGNTGVAADQFLGTIDSVDLVFRRHNVQAGLLGYFNTSMGVDALNSPNIGRYNTALGNGSLRATTGLSNTAVGFHSLRSTTSGNYNTAFGDSALVDNTIGTSNVGIGAYTLYKMGTTGQTAGLNNHVAVGTSAMAYYVGSSRGAPNTAVGSSAMALTTSGDGNTAVGGASMYANTTGQDNTALGYWSLRFNTTGRENLAIGTTSLRQNTIGIQNIGIGREALRNDSSGNGNVGIGYQVGYSNFNGSKNVFIGFQAGYSETGSNKLYIANSSTPIPLILGDFATGRVGIGTNKIADTAYKLFVETGIRTRKIKVDAIAWADFVFEPSYQLLPLAEVSSFIQKHKHLPGVYPLAEVQEQGVDLGANQVVLLQKIEELTLYIIDLDKKLVTLEKQLQKVGRQKSGLKLKTSAGK